MPLSNLFSPVSFSGVMQSLGLEPTHRDRPAWSYSTNYREGVDARLTGILSEAAERFAREHPGYTVEAISGKNPRASGTRWHPGGIATDVQITDPSGKKLGNYRDAKSFRTYEQFAQTARAVQKETHPELDDHFSWGGYYGGRFAADQMHFDLGPTRGSLGTWENGLNKAGRNFLPGAESIGMGAQPQIAGVPTPTARPDPLDMANMAPDTTIGSLGPMFGSRQSFAAPLGQVDRAALPDLPASSPTARLAFDAAAGVPQSLAPDRQMPSGPVTGPPMAPGELGALAGSMVGQSLPPDGQMPSGPINVSTDFAPPTASPARPDNLSYAGPKGMFGVAPNLTSPAMMAPALSAPTEVADYNVADVVSPMPGAPASPTVDPTGQFPDAPAAPSTWDKVKYAGKPTVKDAMLGMKVAGPLGALAAPAIGLLGDKLGIGFSHLGPGFDNAAPDRFSTGFGLSGIMGAMGGPKGAQGFSLSNPGMSFTSLGNGMGLRRSDKYGWTEVVAPDGSVKGISYDKTPGGFFGGLFGGVSSSMNDKFGGGISDKERADFSGRVGLF